MKKLMLLFVVGAAICAFVAVQSLNAEQTMPSSQKTPAATSEKMGDQSATQSKQMKSASSREASEKAEAIPALASKVIGKTLVDAKDEKLGKVEDLIVDKSGRISYVIIGFGGLLGAGEKYTAIPWNILASREGLGKDERGDLKINISKADFEKAPTFDKSNLANFERGDLRQRVDSHYSSSGIKKGHAESAPR